MKKLISCFYCLCLVSIISAQDVILKVTGDEIKANVTEVSDTEVKYKKFGDKSGDILTLPKSDVFMITYKNGEKDVFGRQKRAKKTETASKPQVTPAPLKSTEVSANTSSATTSSAAAKSSTAPAKSSTAPAKTPAVSTTPALPPASKQYNVGDVYNENGIRGIVYKATDGGRHGMIFSLNKAGKMKWCSDKTLFTSTEAFSETDGRYNQQAIERFITENGRSWDDFPLFQWSKSLGDGWYIPSAAEMKELFENVIIKGSFDANFSIDNMNQVTAKINSAGGEPLFTLGSFDFWSCSTENEDGTIKWLIHVAAKNKMVLMPTVKKSSKIPGTRAVHAF